MVKPVGGRGHKVPWTTKVVRVPDPVLDTVNKVIEDFYELMDSDLALDDEGKLPLIQAKDQSFPNKSEAIEQAKKIIKAKKNAKLSLLKLLQVLYSEDITETDLIV